MIEIVIITIISIIYIILLTFILKAYYNDTESMEIRILQLEKRIDKIEKENNTQESGDDKMPCGRKGRPKGSKNIGGRRKWNTY